MIVGVMFLDEESRVFKGRHYSYYTDLSVKMLTRVLAPVGDKGEVKRACVVDLDIPITSIPKDIRPILKTITEYDK